jgi:hypothetical protein
VLRRIFGPQREITGGWGSRKFCDDELHNLYSSPNIIQVTEWRRMRFAIHVAFMGKRWNAHKILVRKTEGREYFERPRHRWKDIIEVDLKEAQC